MMKMNGVSAERIQAIAQCRAADSAEPESVRVAGMVHGIRDMGKFTFLTVRVRDGLIQCVMDHETDLPADLKNECAIEITGEKVSDARAKHGFEIHVREFRILSVPKEDI
ncbi:MAG: hypothetical protein LBV27_10980, partial [Oscillospiraceae bacterium]|nr:hypothetical protein [Oscillospiraceae bacterium]